MKLMRTVILLLCVTAAKSSDARPLNDSVFERRALFSFKLTDAAKERTVKLEDFSVSEPLLLFIFLSPECPLCQNYTPVLNALQQQYGKKLRIFGIVPGKTYSAKAVRAFAAKYKTGFTLLIDPFKKMTSYLQASITPEAILLNHQLELVYKGAIDNRLMKLGEQRLQSTENYLQDAIMQSLENNEVIIKRKKAIGCMINDF